MFKYFLRGLLVAIGVLVGFYICSKITLFGFGGSVKEFSQSIGQMFIEVGK